MSAPSPPHEARADVLLDHRCMKGIREEDVRKLGDTDGFDRVLTDMIGAAVVVESKFAKLIEKHY